jgi:hypothetical protein
MKFSRIVAPIGVGVVMALGLVTSFSTPAIAQTKQVCHMKGTWDGRTALWEFDAAYVYNHGEDDFSGVYTSPTASANVSGAARSGVWNIAFNYTDPVAWRGVVKKLTGTGSLDPATHALVVKGTFQEVYASGKAGATGTFAMEGACH